jgi:Dyp-type peroxidase family
VSTAETPPAAVTTATGNSSHPHAHGVLPDDVVRNPESNGFLFGITLRPDLDTDGLQSWLRQLTTLVRDLERGPQNQHRASATVALGQPFFARGDLAARRPAGFLAPPALPGIIDAYDVLIYVMAPREADVAQFEIGLATTRAAGLQTVIVERGFQRRDGREHFGFRDGLRNVARGNRHDIVFIDWRRQPEEPAWANGGSYMAYIKVRQNLDVMALKSQGEQEAIIGRRKTDGSRLDQPEGTDPRSESEIAPGTLPADSHVQKTGPRGPLRDQVQILRRGVPYTSIGQDGTIDVGLQFVSFQASLDYLDVILNRWMLNDNFPSGGAGQDALIKSGAMTFLHSGVYIVPPTADEFIGAPIFAPDPPPHHTKQGRIAVRKALTGPDGGIVEGDLAGATFVVIGPDGNQIGEPFQTNPAGHAESPDITVGTTVTLHETTPLPGAAAASDQSITIDRPRVVVRVINTTANPSGYGT